MKLSNYDAALLAEVAYVEFEKYNTVKAALDGSESIPKHQADDFLE